MKNELVLVRDAEGKPLVRHVFDANERVVFVASDRALELIQAGDPNIYAVGFSRDCVFQYTGKPPEEPVQWGKLKPWKG